MHRERLINRRHQGDLGEASAIEWLTRRGATVFTPLGHSPDVDLVAQIDGRLLRVQVKTTTYQEGNDPECRRWVVGVATNGGNQSWSGRVKRLDPERLDFLFVLTGDGRRWFLPAAAIEGFTTLSLGGTKYSEYEVEPGSSITRLVYREDAAIVESSDVPGEYRSGQPGCAVNALAYAYAGSNPASPIVASDNPVAPTKYERKLGRSGQAVINQKRRMTIPQRAFFEAGLQNGSRVRVRPDGPGRLVVEQVQLPDWATP